MLGKVPQDALYLPLACGYCAGVVAHFQTVELRDAAGALYMVPVADLELNDRPKKEMAPG
jgi:hypothetical protein